MDVSTVSSNTLAMASASQQMQTVMQAQMAMLSELAENQQEVAQLLTQSSLGQNINVMA
ncbi:hypothetical protein [Desulfosarcina ovata]|uniref:Motility protein n=2 Tax=Desulfosarcina ovata TaxID=83564 RepID=A0A5K8AES8_9BACT|nr:hypothetical protein [Desulfosarcina ovata]BBO84710.1 hypothetical protein DSCO28_52760 [Desulfosarcina ovata subsp. sediminis]BBO91203.1 hypothetical protein DSCOOX_43830 [Desulfosarcina ovata subsp. ovata]